MALKVGDKCLITHTMTPVVVEEIVTPFLLRVRVDTSAPLRQPFYFVNPIELQKR